MTNRNMVNGSARQVRPNEAPMPPVPAPEDAATPTTREDPIDSPHLHPNDGRRVREAPISSAQSKG